MSLRNATARWKLLSADCPADKAEARQTAHNSATLDGLSVELEKGKIIGVVGPVGAGKSSLLQIILRELPLDSGSLQINGSISYASQEPWVFAGSIRQNVLFGQEYEKDRYDAVVRACALATDFEQLPNGDRTIIGERSTSLSGGQKARVKWV